MTLRIVDDFFQESEIVVVRGTRVTWINDGENLHTVTSGSVSADVWDSGLLKTGQQSAHTFTTNGQFAYLCKVHEFMNGTVRVI